MATHVTALFHDRYSAHAAVEQLVQAGFPRDQISVLMSETTRGREFAVQRTTRASDGPTSGVTAGGVLGAIIAGLVAVGTIAVPGIGFLAAGPLVPALAGAGAGAAGGMIGALVGAGIPEHEARLAHDRLQTGGLLVGVLAPRDRAQLAKQVLQLSGGEALKAA